MIHLALWIVSTLFVIWFAVACGSLILVLVAVAWRWILGAIALLIVIVLVYSNTGDRPKPVEAIREPSTTLVPHEPTPAELDAVQTALSAAVRNAAPPVPQFANSERRLEYLRWLGAMSNTLKDRHSDFESRKELLQTVWYESRRAGLDTALVLSLIETTSSFRKFYVSNEGARGLMSVGQKMAKSLGTEDMQVLFYVQTNLRFGCVLLRHYLDARNGDLTLALGDYYDDNAKDVAISRSHFAIVVAERRPKWTYLDAPAH